jgi:hypothetical protein
MCPDRHNQYRSGRGGQRVERLLEREAVLAKLGALTRAARQGAGRAVLLRGEAGVGKTAVIIRFTAGLDIDLRVLRGWCDPLAAPGETHNRSATVATAATQCRRQLLELAGRAGCCSAPPARTVSPDGFGPLLNEAGRASARPA